MARLCGIISVVLLFSSGILIAAALYTFVGAKYATGYSFTLMAIAQFLSFLAALLVAHWMVSLSLKPRVVGDERTLSRLFQGHSFTVIN